MTLLMRVLVTVVLALLGPDGIHAQPNDSDFELESWEYAGGVASFAAAAKLSGHYALADTSADRIEIRDIRQDLLHSISRQDVLAVDPSAKDAALCAMTFSPSGRLLFFAMCGAGDDVIFRFNTNTGALVEFARLPLTGSDDQRSSLLHFHGKLYVAGEENLVAFRAQRNDSTGQQLDSWAIPNGGRINALAIDIPARTIYAATADAVHRLLLDSPAKGLYPTFIALPGIRGLAYSRSLGEAGGQLFVLQGGDTAAIVAADPGNPDACCDNVVALGFPVGDIAATPEGRLLAAGPEPLMLAARGDARLDFDAWLIDELQQYVKAIKILAGPSDGIPEGFLARKLVANGERLNRELIADNVGWALYILMAADLADPDPEIEPLVESLVRRHLGEHPDGLGGQRTTDGHFQRTYRYDGELSKNSVAQVYTTMKFLPAAYKAAELYPENEDLQRFKELLRKSMKRSSDTVRAEQRITWQMDEYGPALKNNRMTNETWLYGDLAAAQDPLATLDYARYVQNRTAMPYDDWLQGEPVIRASHSAFIVFGGSIILRHHAESADWQEQNRNYYAASMAAGDDMGARFATAFSAGNNRFLDGRSYYNDGPNDHPGDYIHFPALLGFGQHGHTAAVVGAYMAYRDDWRQEMQGTDEYGNPVLLTRRSLLDPASDIQSIGIADFWFGAIGLAETIRPGTADRLRGEFFRPQLEVRDLQDGGTELHYSEITPRRVLASTDGVKWDDFGFQLTPYAFAPTAGYTHFNVVDPEGELFDIDNAGFEEGLKHWAAFGDFEKGTEKNAALSDYALRIRTTPGSQAGLGGIYRTFDYSVDLGRTNYVVRANGTGKLGDGSSPYLMLRWDNDDNLANGVLQTEIADMSSNDASRIGYVLHTRKPPPATHAHVAFVVENSSPVASDYYFDNFSVVRTGARFRVPNGDFEAGNFGQWVKNSKSISLTQEKDRVLEGKHSVLFRLSADEKEWVNLARKVSVSKDAAGMRYIFRMQARAINFPSADFEVVAEVLDEDGKKRIVRNDIGDIRADTDGETAFTLRKRPGDAAFRLIFRMRRLDDAADDVAEVVIDDLRLYKERLF